MISEITIQNVASYGSELQKLGPCKQVNFIYGANGSGKTTLSRVVNNPKTHTSCAITWQTARILDCRVYNSDFVDSNYAETLEGIFTLGEDTTELIKSIEQAKEKETSLLAGMDALNRSLQGDDSNIGRLTEINNLRSSFEDICWQIKQKHDESFQSAFQGFRGSRAEFCNKLLSESEQNTSELHTLEYLKERSSVIYQKGIDAKPNISPLNLDLLNEIETHPLLATQILGKHDVDLAKLIGILGNSDWVSRGQGYWSKSKPHCPFCQQQVVGDLTLHLEEYFDQSFASQIAALDDLLEKYEKTAEITLSKLSDLLEDRSSYMEHDKFVAIKAAFEARVAENILKLKQKRSEPGLQIELHQTNTYLQQIEKFIAAANNAIATHNQLIANLTEERSRLTGQVWQFVVRENAAEIDQYKSARATLDRAVASISSALEKKKMALEEARSELASLERRSTSVQPTANEINSLLASFGFSNFKLTTAGEHNSLYKIVRHDGTDASSTLSEGERTFTTFLYFYNLIRGSKSPDGISSDRVVVIDDPISSLDSDVLFIVSTLIKKLMVEAISASGSIKQVFVLTHNVYFHKEVSFDPKRVDQCRSHETFWVVRKQGLHSSITKYDYNPIKTAYELLWTDVRNPTPARMTIHNTLRRIVENYFQILGNMNPTSIVEQFEGRDRQVCVSLFSWVNDGSHAVYDDLYVAGDDAATQSYLRIFRSIFEKTGHIQHYNMMMGVAESDYAVNSALLQ